jgi:hypothetical protein
VASVDVPSERTADGWTVPRPLRVGEVDAALRDAAKIAALEGWLDRGALAGFGVLGALPIALLLLGVSRSRRRPNR